MLGQSWFMRAALVCAGLPMTAAPAKPPLEKARPGAEVQPLAIARVARVNGQMVLTGDWTPYSGAEVRSGQINAPFFDSFGRGPGTAYKADECVPTCDTVPDTGGRWYFGSAYHNPNTIEDMQDCACPPSSVISEIDLGWFWCPPGAGRCIVIFFPLEQVLDSDPVTGLCYDPLFFTETGGGGVALDFGVLPPGCPFYYYSRQIGIESLGVLSPTHDDNGDANGFADGSYQMIIASAITSSAITLASGPCQPMLWGTSRGYNGSISTGPAICAPGLNNNISYDDDNPTDGAFANPSECHDYAYLLCPDPLGKDICFCFKRCPADYNYDGFVDGIDSDQFHNDFEAGSSCADLNGDCFVDGIDADYFSNQFESPCP